MFVTLQCFLFKLSKRTVAILIACDGDLPWHFKNVEDVVTQAIHTWKETEQTFICSAQSSARQSVVR